MDTSVRTKVKRVVIDSRDRDVAAFPNPNSYQVQLPDDIVDVMSVALLVAEVPFTSYLVGPSNNAVPLSVSGGAASVAYLPTGDYADVADLTSTLRDALSAASAGAVSHVDYSPRTDAITVRGSSPFTLDFASTSNSAARILGFSPYASYASSGGGGGTYSVTAPFRKDLSPERYVILNFTPNAELLVSANNATDRSFAIVPRRYTDLSIDTVDAPTTKTWATPLARISKVGIAFTHYNGDPYDFQNQEHRLELLFTFVANRKYLM